MQENVDGLVFSAPANETQPLPSDFPFYPFPDASVDQWDQINPSFSLSLPDENASNSSLSTFEPPLLLSPVQNDYTNQTNSSLLFDNLNCLSPTLAASLTSLALPPALPAETFNFGENFGENLQQMNTNLNHDQTNESKTIKQQYKSCLQVLTFDAKKIPISNLNKERNLYTKNLKRAIAPAIRTAFQNRERLTIYVVPESLESDFGFNAIHSPGENLTPTSSTIQNNVDSPSTFPHSDSTAGKMSRRLKKLLHYALQVHDELNTMERKKRHHNNRNRLQVKEKKARLEHVENNLDKKNLVLSLPFPASSSSSSCFVGKKRKAEEHLEKEAKNQRANRLGKVKNTIGGMVVPTMQLPILIFTRLKHPNVFCPNQKLFAILHYLQHPNPDMKGQKRYQGSIFIPVVQENLETKWNSMSVEERYQWSLSEQYCPLRLRKFSEVVKYTLNHAPFSADLSTSTVLSLKELPPGPKSWYVHHEHLPEPMTLVECASKIVSNSKFNPALYHYGALSKGKIKGSLATIHLPFQVKAQMRACRNL